MGEIQKVGVFGHYGNKNLGDEAIILAVIQNLKQRVPDIEIKCFSINPKDSEARYGVLSYPIRMEKNNIERNTSENLNATTPKSLNEIRNAGNLTNAFRIKKILKKIPYLFTVLKFIKNVIEFPFVLSDEICFLRKSFRSVKDLDLLLFTGSNQFLDNFGGSWGFPYTLFKWTVLARLAGNKVAHVSIGAGPLDKILSKAFICGSVCLSHYLSFRDKGSSNLTKRFLGFKVSHIFPDLAHSLHWEQAAKENRKTETKERVVVGINPMPIYDKRYWHISDDSKYCEYVEKIGGFTSFLVEQGFDVVLFGTHPKDNDVSADVFSFLSRQFDSEFLSRCSIKSVDQVLEVMALISSFDFVLATRFHGVLLSLLARKCVVALCYGEKTKELMVDSGQGRYALDFESFFLEELKSVFLDLYKNSEYQKSFIDKKEQIYINCLDKQYERVLKLLR